MIDSCRRRVLAWLSLGATATGAAALARAVSGSASASDDLAAGPMCRQDREPARRPAPGRSKPPEYARFSQPLRLPRDDGLLAELPASATRRIVSRSRDFAVLPGVPTPLWHYAVEVEGRALANPMLRIERGQFIDVELDNRLTEATTIHWHGLSVDEANDGSGLHPVEPGALRRYRFEVRNRAGLYWYHAHPHRRTGIQVQRGMAGLMLVEDEEERALQRQLGLVRGETDLALMLADKQIGADNRILYREDGADDWIGNVMLVNWTPEPYLDVVPQLYRLRLVNASNARLLRLAFVRPGGAALPFRLIGTDGGLLAEPWPIEDVFLAPAQRIDVLVDLSRAVVGERLRLRSLAYVAMDNDSDATGALAPDPMGDHPGAVAMGQSFDLMELRIGEPKDKPAPRTLPRPLSALPPAPDTRGWRVRTLLLHMDAQGAWFVNEWNFHKTGHAPAFTVRRGSREVWEIRNAINSMPHPVHVHGFLFRVLARSISPADVRAQQVAPGGLGPQDLGLLDTVLVWPGETVRIALDFSQPLRGTQRYMFHCHNLEHEDKGLMITFAVVD